jgi:cytochrome P450
VGTLAADPTFVIRGGERWRSPWADYRRLRDEAPVLHVEHPSFGTFSVLSRFDDVFEAVRDTVTFSSASGLTLFPNDMALFDERARPIVMMDPPEHTEMRRLVSAPLAPRNVAAVEADVARFVDARLDEIADLGDAETDIVERLFKPLPSMVVARFLGVPDTDRERFDRWTGLLVAANATGDMTAAPRAVGEVFEYSLELIDRRRAEPGDDVVSGLVAAGDERASAMWIVGFVFTMIAGGNDTTTGLLAGAAELLTEDRDQRRVLLDDPSLVRRSVEEFLRLTSPVQNLARTTTRDVERHGTVIPAGRKVLLVYGAANRDEREFGPDAERLDVRRPLVRHLALGYGAHHCLGAAVARMMGAVTLERLLARFPAFEVDGERGRFAEGMFVRRYESLPFSASA